MDPQEFKVLQIVHHTRRSHGIRSSDYDAYAHFCARRAARLRKQLGKQAKGKRLKKEILKTADPDERHLHLFLLESERAWSQSQIIRAQLQMGKVPKRARQHLQRRLARASKYAAEVAVHARQVANLSASSVAQTEAYALAVRGSHAFEAGKWQHSLDLLAAATTILDDIASFASDVDLQAYAYEAQDEISPMLRVCRYHLQVTSQPGEPSRVVSDWPNLRRRLETEGNAAGERAEPVCIEWKDRREEVRNPELARAVSKAQSAVSSMDEGLRRSALKAQRRKKPERAGVPSLVAFDAALTALTDAEELARQSVDDNQLALDKAHSSRFQSATAPLRFTHAYLKTRLLVIRCQRDLLLATGARKAAASVKLFDAALLSLEQLVNIDMLIEDGDAAEALEARAVLVRGQRCMHLAKAYSQLRQHPKAALLAERAVLYARQARPGFMPAEDELDSSLRPLALTKEDVDAFERAAEATRRAVGESWFAAGPDQDEATTLDSLNLDGRSRRHKPLFFDVAVNYATHPEMQEIARRAGKDTVGSTAPPAEKPMPTPTPKATQEAMQQVQGKKGGWLGFWR